MIKADSHVLLIEEIKDILSDLGTLSNTALEVDFDDNKDANYARTWYIFNLGVVKGYAIGIGTHLAILANKRDEYSPDYFDLVGKGREPADSYAYLQDTYHLHDHLDQGISTALLAYDTTIEDDRVLYVLTVELKKHWKLMTENLKLIKERA